MTKTSETRKKIDSAYATGDIETAVTDYRKLSQAYTVTREETRRLTAPEGYSRLRQLALVYEAEAAAYYTTAAQIVEDSGGNYNAAQAAKLADQEKRLNAAAKKLQEELKVKRFELK